MGLLHLLNKTKDKDKMKKEVSYNDKTFILSMENDYDKLMDVLCRKFNVDNSGDGQALIIHNDDITISVEMAAQSMGGDTEKFIKKEVTGICNHFYNVDTKHNDIKTNLIYSINLTKSMIFINYSFLEDNKADKKAFIEQSFAEILNEIQGIMLVRGEKEDCMYCQSPDKLRVMELILSDKGKSSLLNYVPYEELKMPSDNKDICDEQLKRRERTRKIMLDKYIYVPASYPVIQGESKVISRTAKEIAERAVALLIVSAYSEYRLRENASYEDSYNFVKEIIKKYDAEKMFSPKEREMLNNPAPTRQELIVYSWHYESLFVMEWALGLVDGTGTKVSPVTENTKEASNNASAEKWTKASTEALAENKKEALNKELAENWTKALQESMVDKLYFPDRVCDVNLTIELLKKCDSFSDIVAKSNLKSKKQLLDECDLISCLDWSCVDTRIHDQLTPAGMIEGVVNEWHRALNWLVGANDRADWDDVNYLE